MSVTPFIACPNRISRLNPILRRDKVLEWAGKCLIASLFWWSGINGLLEFSDVVSSVAEVGFPVPTLVGAAALALEILAPAILFVPRLEIWAAGVLALYCLLTALFFHDYWMLEGPARFNNEVNFFKNLALAGALLVIMARDLERRDVT
jgi:putative oxidoreductase